jgi:hypothetical protein
VALDHIFRELHTITSLSAEELKATSTKFTTIEAQHCHRAIESGVKRHEAILRAIARRSSPASRYLFGERTSPIRVRLRDKTVWTTDIENSLAFRFDTTGGSATEQPEYLNRPAYLVGDAVLVTTNFDGFTYYFSAVESSTCKAFMAHSLAECAEEVRLVGSLWASMFPAGIALVTRTIALAVPESRPSVLFSRAASYRTPRDVLKRLVRKPDIEDEALGRLKAAISNETLLARTLTQGAALISLNELATKLERFDPTYCTVTREMNLGSQISRSYRISLPNVLNFVPTGNSGTNNRGDHVLTYLSPVDGGEYHRDFCLDFGEVDLENIDHYRIVLTLTHLMGMRRSGLFRVGFSKRVYNVVMPPITLARNDHAELGYLIVPVFILYRVPNSGTFRRTFSLSFITLPVLAGQQDPRATAGTFSLLPRKVKADETVWVRDALRKPYLGATGGEDVRFRLAGPLAQHLGLSGEVRTFAETLHIAMVSLLSTVHVSGSGSIFRRTVPPEPDSLDKEHVFSATAESRIASVIHLVNWQTKVGKSQPWDDWVQTFNDLAIRDNIYKRMFYEDFVEPVTGYTGRQTIDLRSMLVGNRLRTDMNGMTFYDPTAELKLIIYPEVRERYPNFSVLRWMVFSLFQDAAVAAMQRMIQQYHSEEGDNVDILHRLNTLEELVRSFGELYELDIRYPIYRSEYQGIRDLANIDKDYMSLRERMKSSKEDAALREQRLFNKLVVALALGTVTITMLTFIAEMQKWAGTSYILVGLPLLAVVAYLAIRLFDPLRRRIADKSKG